MAQLVFLPSFALIKREAIRRCRVCATTRHGNPLPHTDYFRKANESIHSSYQDIFQPPPVLQVSPTDNQSWAEGVIGTAVVAMTGCLVECLRLAVAQDVFVLFTIIGGKIHVAAFAPQLVDVILVERHIAHA